MTVENVHIEPDRVLDSGPDPFEVSDADTMIKYLDKAHEFTEE
jgi:peroxiredoxin